MRKNNVSVLSMQRVYHEFDPARMVNRQLQLDIVGKYNKEMHQARQRLLARQVFGLIALVLLTILVVVA